MDAEYIAVAQACLGATHDGRLSFPAIVGKLLDAGFEGYSVDYRRNRQTYYLPDGTNVDLEMPRQPGLVAAMFDGDGVERLVRWAQADGPDYSYDSFCEKAVAAGCAGYLVSFLGRRIVYYGRTGETHVELMPR